MAMQGQLSKFGGLLPQKYMEFNELKEQWMDR